MSKYNCDIIQYISDEIACLQKLDVNEISKALILLEKTLENGKKIYIFGNGGSASTASHFQCDFNKMEAGSSGKKFQFVSLNDNISTLMAIANDIGYDDIFCYQLDGRIQEGDIVIAISGSGNSENVIRAVSYAKNGNNKVIGITGFNGGRLKEIADISLHVPIDNMQISEDIHLIFNHMMVYILKSNLYKVKD